MQMQAITTGGCGHVVCAVSIGRSKFAFVRRDNFFSHTLTLQDEILEFTYRKALLYATPHE